ncbi:MAG: hypothetical protein ACLFNO_02480 [Parcubacteria group bacterium]
MKKNQKNSLKAAVLFTVLILLGTLMNSCEKTHDVEDLPSSLEWSEDLKDQIETIRQSENIDLAEENLEQNDFPLKVLSQIPEKAEELNLPWADQAESLKIELSLFTAGEKLKLLDESTNKEFKARLSGFEPGFIVDYNNDFHHYLLESFTKVLNDQELELVFLKDYKEVKEEKKVDEVIKSVHFTSQVYPCSVYDNIHYWIVFAKDNDIKLKGHGEFYDKEWRDITYDEAQDKLDIGYIIALNLPKGSKYVKMQSGQEFVETPEKKMAVSLP